MMTTLLQNKSFIHNRIEVRGILQKSLCIFLVLISCNLFLQGQAIPAGCNYQHQPVLSTSTAVCASTDDASQRANGTIDLTGSTLSFGTGAQSTYTGVRFKSVTLPANAVVDSAIIQFHCSSSESHYKTFDIYGENLTQNSATFSTTSNDISSRATTTATESWTTINRGFGSTIFNSQTPDLGNIVNEFINEGWTSGDPMTFIFMGVDTSLLYRFTAFDHSDGIMTPVLTIFYSLPTASCTGISGFVYNDYDDSGAFQDATGICENGIPDITVNLYDDNGLVGSVTTDSFGNWTYPALAGDTLRVEYIYPPEWEPAKSSTLASSTETVFVGTTECCIDFGLHQPEEYACSDPQVLAVCHVKCDISDPGQYLTIVSFAESDKGNSATLTDYQSTVHPIEVTYDTTGSIWGLSYNKEDDVFYAGATWFNLSGLGTDGSGAIYCVDNATNNGTHASVNDSHVSLLTTIPNAGTDPTGGTCVGNDPNNFKHAAKVGLGDVDINTTNDTLFTINLNTRQLVVIPVDGCSTTGAIEYYNIPTPTGTFACTTDTLRPWALKYHEGAVYVGAVCDGENSQSTDSLWAYVFRFTTGGGFSSTPVLDFPLNYARSGTNFGNNNLEYPNMDWHPWLIFDPLNPIPDSLYKSGYTQFSYPQPIFSDIEFDKCDMILGFTDRFGFQFLNDIDPWGYANDQLGDPTHKITSTTAGDMLRAGANGNTTWTIEDNAAVNGDKTGATQTAGAYKQGGPGGGEYYYGENYGITHGETVVGGLAQIPGWSDVMVTTFDPTPSLRALGGVSRFGSGGVNWINNTTGDFSFGWEGYAGSAPYDFGKGNGFGDLEYICDCPPIEIGNRVWFDLDADGVQDPTEIPINNVILELYDDTGTLIGTTTTDADGRYYFNDANVNQNGASGLDTLTDYYIAIAASNFDANGDLVVGGSNYGELTLANNSTIGDTDINDSDGIDPTVTSSGIPSIDSNNLPYIALRTGDVGENQFVYDFGFNPCTNPNLATVPDTICIGDNIDLSLLVSDSNNIGGSMTYYTALSDVTNQTNPLPSAIVSPLVDTKYYVREDTISCYDIDSLMIVVNNITAPVISKDTSYCENDDPIALTATTTANGDGSLSYQWQSNTTGCTSSFTDISSGGTSATYDPPSINTTTYYRVITTSTLGTEVCKDTSNCITLTVTENPTVTVADVLKCTSNAETIIAIANGGTGSYTYSWIGPSVPNPSIDSSYSTSIPGIYTVTILDENGCVATASGELTVQSKTCLPATFTIKRGDRE